MKHLLMSVCLALAGMMVVQSAAEARRLGGGSSSGMKRTAPAPAPKPPAQSQQASPAPAQNAAAPAAVPPTAAAAPQKRSWMGPVAGLAAGLGLAALASHLGFGEGLANMMLILLFVVGGAMLVGLLMRHLAARKVATGSGMHAMQFANAGASAGTSGATPPPMPFGSGASAASGGSMIGSNLSPAVDHSAHSSVPEGFDNEAFETIAKRVFIRLQAANDAGDLDDLRRFTTPEMFAVASQELLDRSSASQHTEVVQLQAAVAEHAQESGNQIVSVRFTGLIREEKQAPAVSFDEIWHLLRPLDGSREWAIAGIQQVA